MEYYEWNLIKKDSLQIIFIQILSKLKYLYFIFQASGTLFIFAYFFTKLLYYDILMLKSIDWLT